MIQLKTYIGDDFTDTTNKAKQLATDRENVFFEFNDIKCIVSKTTNLDLLWRDYMNSHIMKWESIGPECSDTYAEDVQDELNLRNKRREEKDEAERIIRDEKEQLDRSKFLEKTKDIKIELIDADGWNKSVQANSDPYGAAGIEYAEGWAKLMQLEMSKGKSLRECAEKTSFQLGFLGITGFMYGCAVGLLSRCWKHGEELRKWHNKDYGHDGDGVVNPAVINISK